MSLLVPAYPGCPGSKAVKRSLLLCRMFDSKSIKKLRINLLTCCLHCIIFMPMLLILEVFFPEWVKKEDLKGSSRLSQKHYVFGLSDSLSVFACLHTYVCACICACPGRGICRLLCHRILMCEVVITGSSLVVDLWFGQFFHCCDRPC